MARRVRAGRSGVARVSVTIWIRKGRIFRPGAAKGLVGAPQAAYPAGRWKGRDERPPRPSGRRSIPKLSVRRRIPLVPHRVAKRPERDDGRRAGRPEVAERDVACEPPASAQPPAAAPRREHGGDVARSATGSGEPGPATAARPRTDENEPGGLPPPCVDAWSRRAGADIENRSEARTAGGSGESGAHVRRDLAGRGKSPTRMEGER